MTRQQQIEAGKIWQVYPDGEKDTILYEGSRARCMDFITLNYQKEYKAGTIRVGKLIWEKSDEESKARDIKTARSFFKSCPFATKVYMAMKTKLPMDFIQENWIEITS